MDIHPSYIHVAPDFSPEVKMIKKYLRASAQFLPRTVVALDGTQREIKKGNYEHSDNPGL